jgi:hypothetical protein
LAARFADALKVRGYPTISVIAPNPDKIVELARIEGYHHGDAIGRSLETTLAGLLSGPLLSITEAERQLLDSGLVYKGHPVGSCDRNKLANPTTQYVTPEQLRKEVEALRQ